MLNYCREKAEDLIDHLCKETSVTARPRTYRKVARKEYLNISKIERKTDKALRRALRLQINYVRRDIKIINRLLDRNLEKSLLGRHQLRYFFVMQHVLEQQEKMFRDKSNSCPDRIVSIHQPHVRPIVRGKA